MEVSGDLPSSPRTPASLHQCCPKICLGQCALPTPRRRGTSKGQGWLLCKGAHFTDEETETQGGKVTCSEAAIRIPFGQIQNLSAHPPGCLHPTLRPQGTKRKQLPGRPFHTVWSGQQNPLLGSHGLKDKTEGFG